MKKTTNEGLIVKDSNNQTTKESNNLPSVEIPDNTTTKGKVSAKFTIVNDSEVTDSIEKPDKNKVFADVSDYFCPIKFDTTQLENSLQPLVNSGILSEDAMISAIEKSKKEFFEANSEIIEKANNLTFSQVIDKLKENGKLYQKVLQVCNISDIVESEYINEEGKVKIYRANQCLDKEGNNRYMDVTLYKDVNGKRFSQSLFVELREQTTANILLSIRYNQSKRDATRKLFNQISEYNRILVNVTETAKKAKENGFSYSQVIDAIKGIFND